MTVSEATNSYPVSPRNRVKRLHERGRYDHATVHSLLDASMLCHVSYVIDGSSRFPKETLDVVGDGRNGRLDNFQRVTVWSGKGKSGHRVLTGQDKGQRIQLECFLNAVRTGSDMPIPLESLVATTRATLAVERSLSQGRPVSW